MINPELKIPPLLLLAFAMVGVLLCHLAWPMHWPQAVSLVGVLAAAAGLGCCMAGVMAFRRHATTVDPRYPQHTVSLVTGGVYAYSRNPMYLGFALMLLGWSLYLNALSGLIWLGFFIAYLQRFQIQPEERYMQNLFGEQFASYCRRTHRWWGRTN